MSESDLREEVQTPSAVLSEERKQELFAFWRDVLSDKIQPEVVRTTPEIEAAVQAEEPPPVEVKDPEQEKKAVEAKSQSQLKLAKGLMSANNAAARKRLKDLVDKYPDTDAAKEAERLLKK